VKVGIIGLGNLGLEIARNLIQSDFDVYGYRRSDLDHFVKIGGKSCSSPVELSQVSDVILTCLPDSQALNDVFSGEDGILSGLKKGQIVVEMSTIPIQAKRVQFELLQSLGGSMLDCTVSGNPNFMSDRKAALFVSGDLSEFEKCLPLLEGITSDVRFVGNFGCGSALKAIATTLVSVHTLVAAEVMVMGKCAGLDRETVFEAISGTQASSAMFETRGKSMVDGSYPKTAGLKKYYNNIEMALTFASESGGEFPLLSAMSECFAEAIDKGYGDVDYAAIYDFLSDEGNKK
jgi:3-hydroxyisobutyrate dehydrogenase-like beta-hydroxyacid dehydrogenase